MDYKEKYEALLANIKAYHARFGPTCNLKKELEECVPELQESEDERNWKAVLEYVKDDALRAWLERHKEQKPVMIQWTGKNLKEVIDFTGKSPKFGEWFKSWEDFENYVHSHDDILKLFCEDGSHYEAPVGAWIVKTPDGYNIPSRFRFVQKPAEWSEEDEKTLDEMREHYIMLIGDRPDISPGKRWEAAIQLIDKIKSLRPEQVGKVQFSVKAEVWTPTEDELRDLKHIVEQNKGNFLAGNLRTLYKDLCALRPQPHWKPSEEQMDWLGAALRLSEDKPHIHEVIESLYNDLKKQI